MQKRIEKTMKNQMRFGSVLGGGSAARAETPRTQEPPPINHKKKNTQPTNAQAPGTKTQHTNAHVPGA